MNAIKAIETRYQGYRFRSRLEARWAVFFDHIGWRWEYEPEAFRLPSGPYLPDFLVNGDRFVEIKGQYNEPDHDRLIELCALSGKEGMFLTDVHNDECGHYVAFPTKGGWDYGHGFWKCNRCGEVTVAHFDSGYNICPLCRGVPDHRHPALKRAINAARSARFGVYEGLGSGLSQADHVG